MHINNNLNDKMKLKQTLFLRYFKITFKIISYLIGFLLMIIAISIHKISWFLLFGIPGVLLIYAPDLLPKYFKKKKEEKLLEVEIKRRMSMLNLDPRKDWQEYYKIKNELLSNNNGSDK